MENFWADGNGQFGVEIRAAWKDVAYLRIDQTRLE